jgi:hypothetical protein
LTIGRRFPDVFLGLVLLAGGVVHAADERPGSVLALTARSESGQSVGSFLLEGASPMNRTSRFVSPSGRQLEASLARTALRNVFTFRDVQSGETLFLVAWTSFAGADELHRPYLFSMGGEVLHLSLPNQQAAWEKARPALRKRAADWIRGRSKALTFLEQAFRAAHTVWHSPAAPTFLQRFSGFTTEPLRGLGFFFEAPASAELRLESVDPETLGVRLPPAIPVGVADRTVATWSATVLDAKDQPLGRLQLARLPGAGRSSIGPLSLELRLGKRVEKLVVLEVALPDGSSAGEFSAAFLRETEASRQLLARLNSVDGKGPEWYEPWLVEDVANSKQIPFEIPPNGENERRRTQRSILEALNSAIQGSGSTSDEAARTIWRWSRVLAEPEVQDAGGPFGAVSRLLANSIAPQFDAAAESGWLGSIRVRKEEGKQGTGR